MKQKIYMLLLVLEGKTGMLPEEDSNIKDELERWEEGTLSHHNFEARLKMYHKYLSEGGKP